MRCPHSDLLPLPPRHYNALPTWVTYPAYTCIIAWDTTSYSTFIGNPNSYNDIKTWSTANYNTTGSKPYAWVPNTACSTAYPGMCEVPRAYFTCPAAPPPVPPPAPYSAGLCLPANDATNWCPTNGTSCYFYNSTTAPYATHKLACAKRGGYLVSWNRCAQLRALLALELLELPRLCILLNLV